MKILKKAVVPIFISIIFGLLCGRVVYKIYLDDSNLKLDSDLIYLLQSDSYDSYDNMRANTTNYNYIYYKEDNLYKTIIGVTKNKENIDKIKLLYNKDLTITKYRSEDTILNDKIIEYDKKLSSEEDIEKSKQIIIEMLNLYKDENDIKMIKVSWYFRKK